MAAGSRRRNPGSRGFYGEAGDQQRAQTGQMADLVNRTEEKAREYLESLNHLNLNVVSEEEFSSEIAAGRGNPHRSGG